MASPSKAPRLCCSMLLNRPGQRHCILPPPFSRAVPTHVVPTAAAASSALGRTSSEAHQCPITHQSAQMMGVSDLLLSFINYHEPTDIPARALTWRPVRSSCAPISVLRLRIKASLCCLVIGREQGLSWIHPRGLYPCIISVSTSDTSRGRISQIHYEKRRRQYIYSVKQKLKDYHGSVSHI